MAAKKRTGNNKALEKKHKVSSELAEIIGCETASRGEIVKKVWAYIKAHNLKDPKNGRMICPDAKLAKVLGKNRIHGFKMAKPLEKHILD